MFRFEIILIMNMEPACVTMHACVRRHRPSHVTECRCMRVRADLYNVSERVNEEPQSARGRSKYSTYQNNFKAGRKSSSLMNLCGKRRLINTIRLSHVGLADSVALVRWVSFPLLCRRLLQGLVPCFIPLFCEMRHI